VLQFEANIVPLCSIISVKFLPRSWKAN